MDGDDMIHKHKHPVILRFAAWLIMRIPGSKTSCARFANDGSINYHTRHLKVSAVIFPITDDETHGYISIYIGNGNFTYWFDKKEYGDELDEITEEQEQSE